MKCECTSEQRIPFLRVYVCFLPIVPGEYFVNIFFVTKMASTDMVTVIGLQYPCLINLGSAVAIGLSVSWMSLT